MYENTYVGKWDDHDCEDKLNYICKGPVSKDNPDPIHKKCSISGFNDFSPYKSNCYWFSKQPRTWYDAEEDCKSQGAHLMSILDDSEQSFVFAHMHSEIIWIGLGDIEVWQKLLLKEFFFLRWSL